MSPVVQASLSIGIIAYLGFAWGWSAPERSLPHRCARWARVPVLWAGLWHSWNVFLPNPPRANAWLTARVWFEDGSHATWRPPNLGRMSIFRAFLSMRSRKFHRNLLMSKNCDYRGSFARYIARRYAAAEPKPVRIDLLQHVRRSSPPGSGEGFEPIQERYVIHVERLGP